MKYTTQYIALIELDEVYNTVYCFNWDLMKYTTQYIALLELDEVYNVARGTSETRSWTHKAENTQLNAHSRNSHRRCQVENTQLNTPRWTHTVDVIGENA